METNAVAELKQLIERHAVRYELWPHYEIADGKRVIVGFDLELYGTHDHGETRLSPGCRHCSETFADLRRVAEWILPKERRPSQYEFAPFDRSLNASAGGRFEVVLPIRIGHRHGFFDPVDDCEERCLKEMQQKLAELGVSCGRGAKVQ
ncbi:MAG TPA: hypothetical protein VHN81_03775 [Edaphobacter sp.]|nr:hypothetical protein [Edaphobacter sp.]